MAPKLLPALLQEMREVTLVIPFYLFYNPYIVFQSDPMRSGVSLKFSPPKLTGGLYRSKLTPSHISRKDFWKDDVWAGLDMT